MPGIAQIVGAFRRGPDKPELSGDPTKDLPDIVDYISDMFEHSRTNDQMVSVLSTTSAVLDILGDL